MGRRKHRRKHNEYVYIPPKIEYIYNSNYNMKIDNSLIKNGGLGVFTLDNIPNNTLLGEYIGEKEHIDENNSQTCYSLSLESDYYIDAFEYPRTVFAMINDCRFSDYKYNCTFEVYPDKAEI